MDENKKQSPFEWRSSKTGDGNLHKLGLHILLLLEDSDRLNFVVSKDRLQIRAVQKQMKRGWVFRSNFFRRKTSSWLRALVMMVVMIVMVNVQWRCGGGCVVVCSGSLFFLELCDALQCCLKSGLGLCLCVCVNVRVSVSA